MPVVPLETFTCGDAIGIIEYQDANMRISRFYWESIPALSVVNVEIWDTLDASYPDPVFSGSFTDSGETPIAGNYQAEMESDPYGGDSYPAIPSNIIIRFAMSSPGS